MVLEYIDGKSLKDTVASGGPLSEKETVARAITMCDILEFLHSKNPPLVHRDSTPDNLIVSAGGVLKLIDFTVADQNSESVTATIVGKQSYMPPEQFRGKAVPQSDLYALGATIYFLLTGNEPEPLVQLHPQLEVENVTAAMDQLVARCTSLDLDKRYRSAAEVKGDLESLSIEGQSP